MGSQRAEHSWTTNTRTHNRFTVLPCFCLQQHESAVSVIHSPSWASLPPTPPQAITERQPESSVLHGSFPLASCFTHGRVYVSMLLSQFVPPSPSPTVSTIPQFLWSYSVLMLKMKQWKLSCEHPSLGLPVLPEDSLPICHVCTNAVNDPGLNHSELRLPKSETMYLKAMCFRFVCKIII